MPSPERRSQIRTWLQVRVLSVGFMDIFVLSKKLAEKYEMQEPHVWISISDPGDTTTLLINPHTEDVLRLYFDDMENYIEWERDGWDKIYKRDCVMFDMDMGYMVFDFFQKHKRCENLMIHCHAGISRSAAIGSFLSQILGKKNFMDPPYFPNSHVRGILRRVWMEKTGLFIP